VALDAVWFMGDSPGPGVGGYLAEATGYPGLSVLPVCTGVLCLVLFVTVLRRFYRVQKEATSHIAA
jgi:hypothetical protein